MKMTLRRRRTIEMIGVHAVLDMFLLFVLTVVSLQQAIAGEARFTNSRLRSQGCCWFLWLS